MGSKLGGRGCHAGVNSKRRKGERSVSSHVQSNQIENPSHIQIQRLLTLPVLKLLKRPAPTTGRIGNKNIHASVPDLALAVPLQLLHFTFHLTDESLNLVGMPDVGGDGDGMAGDVGDGVEFVGGGGEVRSVAGRDDDHGAAGLEERG